MSTGNDGSTLCDVCSGQLYPGCRYSDGSTDTVAELWPGFHARLDCMREKFGREHRASVREEALCALRHRVRELEGMRQEPESMRVSALAMLAWEAAEPVRDGALDRATAMAKMMYAADLAGIDPVTARQTVASAFAEVGSWAVTV